MRRASSRCGLAAPGAERTSGARTARSSPTTTSPSRRAEVSAGRRPPARRRGWSRATRTTTWRCSTSTGTRPRRRSATRVTSGRRAGAGGRPPVRDPQRVTIGVVSAKCPPTVRANARADPRPTFCWAPATRAGRWRTPGPRGGHQRDGRGRAGARGAEPPGRAARRARAGAPALGIAVRDVELPPAFAARAPVASGARCARDRGKSQRGAPDAAVADARRRPGGGRRHARWPGRRGWRSALASREGRTDPARHFAAAAARAGGPAGRAGASRGIARCRRVSSSPRCPAVRRTAGADRPRRRPARSSARRTCSTSGRAVDGIGRTCWSSTPSPAVDVGRAGRASGAATGRRRSSRPGARRRSARRPSWPVAPGATSLARRAASGSVARGSGRRDRPAGDRPRPGRTATGARPASRPRRWSDPPDLRRADCPRARSAPARRAGPGQQDDRVPGSRISEHTVKFHVAAILAKLGAASRTEAVHLAARRGLVALSPARRPGPARVT